jgi:hypothetical protein
VHFRAKDDNSLEVDFGALDLSTPHLTLPSSIGNGLQFVSKFMSSKLGGKPESMKPLLDYLLTLNYRGEVPRDHSAVPLLSGGQRTPLNDTFYLMIM